jgi:hypothetical protein
MRTKETKMEKIESQVVVETNVDFNTVKNEITATWTYYKNARDQQIKRSYDHQIFFRGNEIVATVDRVTGKLTYWPNRQKYLSYFVYHGTFDALMDGIRKADSFENIKSIPEMDIW